MANEESERFLNKMMEKYPDVDRRALLCNMTGHPCDVTHTKSQRKRSREIPQITPQRLLNIFHWAYIEHCKEMLKRGKEISSEMIDLICSGNTETSSEYTNFRDKFYKGFEKEVNVVMYYENEKKRRRLESNI